MIAYCWLVEMNVALEANEALLMYIADTYLQQVSSLHIISA